MHRHEGDTPRTNRSGRPHRSKSSRIGCSASSPNVWSMILSLERGGSAGRVSMSLDLLALFSVGMRARAGYPRATARVTPRARAPSFTNLAKTLGLVKEAREKLDGERRATVSYDNVTASEARSYPLSLSSSVAHQAGEGVGTSGASRPSSFASTHSCAGTAFASASHATLCATSSGDLTPTAHPLTTRGAHANAMATAGNGTPCFDASALHRSVRATMSGGAGA